MRQRWGNRDLHWAISRTSASAWGAAAVSRYLSNSQYAGFSGGRGPAKAWYLFADPTIFGCLPVIEVAFCDASPGTWAR